MKWQPLALLFAAGCSGAPIGELFQAATQCPTETLEGVDVYQGDGTIDWAQVKASGRVFAFMKATQGNYNTQSTFVANWTGSRAAGLSRGPYHYFDATVDGVAQAQWFLDEVTQAGGLQPDDLPPVLDLECPTSPTQSAAGNMCLGNGKSGWAPTATIIQRTFDFLDTVENATGRRPIIYSYPSWFSSFGFTDPRLATYPLWIASPSTTGCATIPAPWTEAAVWQYSFKTHVPGIGGGTANVDADRFIGNAAQLNAFISGNSAGDAGSDGMIDGGAADLAPLDDLSSAPDLTNAADLRAAPRPSDAGGCGCQVGGSSEARGLGWALLAALGLWLRRKGTAYFRNPA